MGLPCPSYGIHDDSVAGPFGGHATLADGLVSYWTLDEASGTRSDSVVASGNDLTDNNTVGSATGIFNNAASFVAANNESLNNAALAALIGADAAITITAWVNFSDGLRHTIVDSGGDGDIYLRAGQDPNGAQFTVKGFTVSAGVASGSIPSQGVWYLLIASYDPATDTASVSVDAGTPATASGGPNGTPADFIIGNRTGNIDPMQGLIDEAAIWSRVLTAQERTDLYNGGVGLFYLD